MVASENLPRKGSNVSNLCAAEATRASSGEPSR